MVAHFTDKHFKYFICLWAIGIAAVHMITTGSGGQYHLYDDVFLIPECVGYFVIGTYLTKVQVRRRILAGLTILGLALTAISTCILTIYDNTGDIYFFQNYFSPTIVLASVPFFVLLTSHHRQSKPKCTPQIEKPSWKQRIMHTISKNTLPIYLLHMIIIYSLQRGFFFGFELHGNTVNSIIGIPLMTALTLGICLIIIIPLKKIPGLRKLIG
jgi:surface polysaccharide O-acyltransferase-like enzyme